MTQAGMTYIQIPVDWQDPSLRDLELFFDVMEANEDRNVYVHCFANMRVSVFVYLYRTLRQGMSEDEAWQGRPQGLGPAHQPVHPPVAPLHHRRTGEVRRLTPPAWNAGLQTGTRVAPHRARRNPMSP